MKISKRLGAVAAVAAAMLAETGAPVQAQGKNELAVYGLIDTYMQYQGGSASSALGRRNGWGLENGGLAGSRWGIRGSESLGDGWSAFFALENGFDPRTGGLIEPARFFNRQAFMGVGGPWGRLSIGHQYTSAFDTMVNVMPLSYAGAYEPFMTMLGPLRVSNSLRYEHRLGPVAVYGHYGAGEAGKPDAGRNAWGAGARYQDESWQVAVAFDQRPQQSPLEPQAMQRKWMAGAALVQGPWRLSAGARWGRSEDAATRFRERSVMAWGGVNYSLNPSLTLSLAYYQERRDSPAFEGTGRQVVAQAIHKLSKRTEVYGAVAHARNSTLNFTTVNAAVAGKAQTGVALGMRHRF